MNFIPRQKQTKRIDAGFSLPEVMVSSSILMMVVAGTAQSQINSINITADSNQLNAVQALIAEDIDGLRRETFRWMCKPGTACTGDPQFADVPMRFLTGDSTALGGDNGFCTTKTLAEHMVNDQSSIFTASSTVSWGSDAPTKAKDVTVNREITATGNEVNISYSTTGGVKPFTTTRTLVPQVLHWCA